MKKVIGLVIMGIVVAGVLYLLYRGFVAEKPLRSPLPAEEGVKVIFITPSK